MFTLTVILLMHIILSNTKDTTKSWDHQHLIHNLMNTKMHSAGRRPLCLPTYTNKYKNVLILTIILSGDIELNPGPHKKGSVYPCGLCELPVTWNCQGVCCDDCNISYPEIMGILLICISKMAVSSSQKCLQRFLKEIFCSGVRAFF